MGRVLIRAALAFSLPILVLGQQQTLSEPTSTPPPISPAKTANTAAEPTNGNEIVLSDGQAIVLRSSELLSSETAKVGDTVQFEVIKPVVVDNLVVIPLHGVATGRIVVAEKKKRRLRAGKLAITVERVRTVTDQTAPLRASEAKGEAAIDYAPHIDPGPGAILAAPFIVFLSHGPEWIIPAATRVVAHLDGDLVLDRAAVQEAQATLPRPRADVGVVYIYREVDSRDYPNNTIDVSCGEALLGVFHPGQFVSLQLPPGEYWLRAGVPARIDKPIDKSYLDGKVGSFFRLNVEQAHVYYLHFRETRRRYRLDTIIGHRLEEVDESVGAEGVFTAQSWADLGLKDITEETLSHLQAQPNNRTRSDN
jgi:hypothetical protein